MEKVTLKKSVNEKKHVQKAATICIVNEDSKVILWAFVKRQNVCQYSPKITGLNQLLLDGGVELKMVKLFF